MEVLDAIIDFGWLQWLAVLFNILYVIYAGLRKRICWIFGAIGVSMLLAISIDVALYSDALLQTFYLFMSIYGFWTWGMDDYESDSVKIRRDKPHKHLFYLLGGVLLTVLLGKFWTMFGAALPYIDAATTSFSLIATYLVAQRYIENWIYWILINAVSVWVFFQKGLPLIAMLYFAFAILAVWGWMRWRREMPI